MRAAPAVSVTITRFGVARCALVLLCVAAGASLLAWLVSWLPHRTAWHPAAFGLACLVIAAAAARVRWRAQSLRWDGQRWYVGPGGGTQGPSDATAGDIEVALDLGAWMLLRFRPDHAASAAPLSRWLPVQRLGLAHDWHALRCAVYSPRPAPRPESAADTCPPTA